jgi:hypothetical protein
MLAAFIARGAANAFDGFNAERFGRKFHGKWCFRSEMPLVECKIRRADQSSRK